MFQFTHPVRGATFLLAYVVHGEGVSIHAPRAGCDMKGEATDDAARKFQFTHPVRGATCPVVGAFDLSEVSIHAPRAGCDYAEGLFLGG